MKTLQYIAILIVTLFCTVSCETDDGYDVYDKQQTAAGKLVYDQTQQTLRDYMATLDFALRIGSYLQATGKKRDSIKFYHLSGWDIIEEEGVLLVRNLRSKWEIVRNSTNSLNTPSSRWSITFADGWGIIPENGVIILTAGAVSNTWQIDVTDYRHYNVIGSASLDVKVKPNAESEEQGIYVYDYEMITKGGDNFIMSVSDRDPSLFKTMYQIIEPAIAREWRFVDGRIEMEVTRASSVENDEVVAEITPDGVSILFRGITEQWSGSQYQ